jgi:CHAT domain-containing protein
LLKRQAVSVLPSVSSLKSLRAFARRDQAVKPMTGFGDPLFNPAQQGNMDKRAANKSASRSVTNIAYTDFWQGLGVDRARLAQALPQLPDTADELNAVAKDLGVAAADIHLGSDASETTVKRAPLADYGIIYFATHGLVAGDVKGVGEPSLALSIPSQPSELDDGLLTASEVAQLKLNADWVVLSACNTIAGDKPGAEALSGLARSFFYAGARALLVSHWAVDSAAATRLTISAFDRLKSNPKMGRAEALRQAMLGYLNDASSPGNAYPALWAPFALIGEGAAR